MEICRCGQPPLPVDDVGPVYHRRRPGPEVLHHGAFFEPSRQRLVKAGVVMLDFPSTAERLGPAAARAVSGHPDGVARRCPRPRSSPSAANHSSQGGDSQEVARPGSVEGRGPPFPTGGRGRVLWGATGTAIFAAPPRLPIT